MARTAKGTGADNRQIILDTAVTMISEKGLERISLARIAAESGLSKGTLYYYYASKADLIFDIADQHMDRITSDLMAMVDDQTPVSLAQLLTAFFQTLLTSEARSRLHLYLVQEAVSGNTSLKARFQSTYAQWFAMADQAYGQMSVSDTASGTKARFLVAVVDGFILQTLLTVTPTQVPDIVRLMLRVIED